jgi:type I restriction enzyme S subunit
MDWMIDKMSELTTLMTNGFVGVAKTHYTAHDNGVLYIQGYNVKENSFNFNGIKRVTEAFHVKNSKSNLKAGDLLTVQTGDVGLTTIVPKELEGSNCHALIISRFKKQKYNSLYFSFYLNSDIGRIRLKGIETGTTMKHINVGDLIHFYVPIPTLKEQTAIATALSDADGLITCLEKLIAKKRNIKQGAMQQLLQPKEGWEVKKLGDIISEIADGGTPPTSNNNYFGGEIYWVVIDDIKEEIFTTKQTLTREGLLNSSARLWQPETIILSTGATIGEVGIAKIPLATKQGICGIVVKDDVSNLFLKYWLIKNKKLILSLAQGSSIKEVRPPTLVKFEIIIPKTKEEQTRIATILSDMDAELSALEQKLEKYKKVKLGMMQELLTGKTRLV